MKSSHGVINQQISLFNEMPHETQQAKQQNRHTVHTIIGWLIRQKREAYLNY